MWHQKRAATSCVSILPVQESLCPPQMILRATSNHPEVEPKLWQARRRIQCWRSCTSGPRRHRQRCVGPRTRRRARVRRSRRLHGCGIGCYGEGLKPRPMLPRGLSGELGGERGRSIGASLLGGFVHAAHHRRSTGRPLTLGSLVGLAPTLTLARASRAAPHPLTEQLRSIARFVRVPALVGVRGRATGITEVGLTGAR